MDLQALSDRHKMHINVIKIKHWNDPKPEVMENLPDGDFQKAI